VVRIAAFEEALDDALFEQPLQAPSDRSSAVLAVLKA